MISYPPALRRTGFIAPRAIGRMGAAVMEARAANAARTVQPSATTPVAHAAGRPGREGRAVVRLWLPLTPLFLMLAPFALLLAPLLYFAPRPYAVRPFATVAGVGALLLSLGGTVVDVDTPEVLVRIRIF